MINIYLKSVLQKKKVILKEVNETKASELHFFFYPVSSHQTV